MIPTQLNSLLKIAQQIQEAGLKEGEYVMNIHEIVDGKKVLRATYESFVEFVGKGMLDYDKMCNRTGNSFYWEWKTKEDE